MTRVRLLEVVDVVVVAALGLTALAQVWQLPDGDLEGGPAVHSVLVAGFTLPLLLRRRASVAAFVMVVGAAWLQFELGGGLGQPFFAVIIALYSVGAHASSPLTLVGPGAVLAQITLADVPRLREGDPVDEVVPAWFILLGVWGFGRWMRHRAGESADLTHRVEAAERETHEQAARAVAEERARLARELHDLVAHSMGVIVIQAQGAQRAIDTAPEQTRAALSSIESTGRAGLAEMRRLLGLLSTTSEDLRTTPQPTLGQLPELVARMRETGVAVDLQVEGDVRVLPPGLELTGFRVVQEAMTNALKHAGAAPVDVRVRYEPDCLEIEVRDGGRAPGEQAEGVEGAGRGLVGMRERVVLYGGTLHTGAQPEGGFAVHARLPVDGRPA